MYKFCSIYAKSKRQCVGETYQKWKAGGARSTDEHVKTLDPTYMQKTGKRAMPESPSTARAQGMNL